MSYIDSNIFIYPILYNAAIEPKAKRAKEILLSIERGEVSAYTSILTWDEVVWVVSKAMGKNEGISQGQKLLGFPNLDFINADINIITRAQNLMEKYNLKPRDCIHIASAIERKIQTIISDDEDLNQIQEIKRIPLS